MKHRTEQTLCVLGLTIHFGVWLPLVVPAPERLAVVLSALLGAEVHGVRRAWPSVTQLVETTGARAKFTVVLWPVRKTRQERKEEEGQRQTCLQMLKISRLCLYHT